MDELLHQIPQQVANGLVKGSLYALVALGYTMVYGIIGLINFAHGEVVMIGAMLTITLLNLFVSMGIHLPGAVLVLMALLIAMPCCMLLAFGMERIAYRPLRKAPRLAPLITAIGISLMMQYGAVMFWTSTPKTFPLVIDIQSVTILGAALDNVKVTIIVTAFAMMLGLWYLVERTKLGKAMRATSLNQEVAGLMGININYVISMTFVIGAALAAIAGVMQSANYGQASPFMGVELGLAAFSAAVLGGIGNIFGAMAGGILLGLIETLGIMTLSILTNGAIGSHYERVLSFVVLIMVLVFRPNGLLGERVAERA
ncbi:MULTISPECIES: branched-chain amino acid ABC transporter permease [Leeia]|uniref:Branched-chain amino acid ABC transporter permease n=1 Tax=Leeia aquatica TaxID=2725557 RepID=A0A847SD27_9NEIS|nr:branched-chain amino acid ABC transporter permease [Leeia aquatica]NLR76835.1 branched-chain amino acid ABC transporter permease [Leeia aquatica]